jgi:hypothetical protein
MWLRARGPVRTTLERWAELLSRLRRQFFRGIHFDNAHTHLSSAGWLRFGIIKVLWQ